MIINSRHKRFDLAERHLSALRSEYGKRYNVKISSRTTESGKQSNRGTYYSFSVTKKRKKSTGQNQYAIMTVEYEDADGKTFHADIALNVPAVKHGTKEEDFKDSIQAFLEKELPEHQQWLAAFTHDADVSLGKRNRKKKFATVREFVRQSAGRIPK